MATTKGGFMVTKISEFDEDSQKIIRRWFAIRSIAESTRETYMSYMTQFLKLNQYSLYEIYVEAQKEQLKDIPVNQRLLTQLILDYKIHIEEKKYAESTKNIKMNVLYSFCNAFEFKIPSIRRKKVLCEVKNYERPIRKSEILKMMNNNSMREKTFLVLQATSGMSSKEARNIKIDDLLKIINEELNLNIESINDLLHNREKILEHNCFEIKLIREKARYRYITYISNECMKHILNYIEFRYKQHGNKKLNNIHEYLFVTSRGTRMSSRAVTGMYREMGKNVGFDSEKNTYRFWRSHNIRKYFYNIVEEIVGIEYADEWLGHTPSKTTQAYARREYRMRQAYLKCLPYLILEEDVSNIKKKIGDLEEEIKQLKAKYE